MLREQVRAMARTTPKPHIKPRISADTMKRIEAGARRFGLVAVKVVTVATRPLNTEST